MTVREQIAKVIGDNLRRLGGCFGGCKANCGECRDALKAADQILTISSLAIVDSEAELPENPIRIPKDVQSNREMSLYAAYYQAQQDMLKQGWRKIVKEVSNEPTKEAEE